MGVPLFEGLSTGDILEWAQSYQKVSEALPMEQREVDKLLRQFVINLVYTVVGDPFRLWMEQVMEARNAKIKSDRNLGIELDPEIMRIFRASTSVSSKSILYMLISFHCSHQW